MKTLLLGLLLVASNVSGASTSGRQADLDFVANQVPRLHANYFYQLDPAKFAQAAAGIAAQLDTLSDAEFYVQLTALLAMAGDPHTAIYLYGPAASSAGFKQFPLLFRWLDDGVFVTAADPAYARALGAQLVAVGGMPIDQVVAQIATIVPHVNDQWVHHMAELYLRGQQVLQGLDVAPAAATSPLTFRSGSGEVFTLDVGTVSSGSGLYLPDPATGTSPDYLLNASQNYWFTYSPANRLLYFKYNNCADISGNPFVDFAATVLAAVDGNPVDTFVYDLRGNKGGNSAVWNPLVDGMAARYASLLSNPRFRVYGVIDKGSFSSGSLDAMHLKQPLAGLNVNDFLRIVGEPTGGSTGGWGNVVGFNLPDSGLSGQYSTQYIYALPYISFGPSFEPDIAIGVRSTDYFARFDPVMAAILARTDAVPPPATGPAIVVNGAGFGPGQGIAPGSFASAFGAFEQVPDQILIAGIPGKIVAATAAQVNFLVPAAAPLGTVDISVRANGSELAAGQANITAAGPGIFAIQNQDSSVNKSSSPAAAGDIVSLYATGNGAVDSEGNAPVNVFFNDTPAEVMASLPLSRYPGLWQINVKVPAGVTGEVPVFAIAGNLASNAAIVNVR